jgi:hypothetical protein
MARVAIGPRTIAAALVAAALVASMNTASPQPRVAPQKAGFVVLAGDFHVHSFPGDGSLPPWAIAREAGRRRLDVIGLTNHNSLLSWQLSQRLISITGTDGAMLIPGEELTAVGYHIAAVGLDRTVAWRQPAAAAAAAIQAAGGVAIAAHPGRRSLPAFDAAAVDALDGVEVAHPAMHASEDDRTDFAAFYEQAKRRHPGIAAIGSTDFHYFAPLGLCRTYVFAKAATRTGILDAIRAGTTVACDGRGEVYGPAELVALVRDDCRRDALTPPDGESWLDALSTWGVWIGLFALVVLGVEEAGLR